MISILKIYIMSALLFIAGIIHFIDPNKFIPALPPFFPYPILIIYSTGLLEVLLSLALIQKNFKTSPQS